MSLPDVLKVAGVDVGSSAIKAVLMTDRRGGDAALVVGRTERIRRRDPVQVARELFDDCLREAGWDAEDLHYVATTGEGDALDWRTGHFYGMTTHARGGQFLDPEARAVIDIGALHTRAVVMDGRAKVEGYRMTSQCASGTGQFLENIARYLGVTLDEVGPLSLKGTTPEKVSGICAVLAETDVINMVSRGISTANILRGIHDSMAAGFSKLLRNARAEGIVVVTGGLSADIGLLSALRSSMDKPATKKDVAPLKDVEIRPHVDGVYAGAIGAALWGAYRAERLAEAPLTASPP